MKVFRNPIIALWIFLLLVVSTKPNKILLFPTVDNGDYPGNSPYFHKTNKKVIGKFKDEAPSIAITQFIGWKSKMCSYIKDDDKGGKTAKGIKKNAIKREHQTWRL